MIDMKLLLKVQWSTMFLLTFEYIRAFCRDSLGIFYYLKGVYKFRELKF